LRDPALPLRTPKKREVLPDQLTMGELERLLTVTGRAEVWERHFDGEPERDRLVLALLAYAGLRRQRAPRPRLGRRRPLSAAAAGT
jgi:site-specific recombinase XerD